MDDFETTTPNDPSEDIDDEDLDGIEDEDLGDLEDLLDDEGEDDDDEIAAEAFDA